MKLKTLPVLTGMLFPVLVRAQILNIDKTDTTDYVHHAKFDFNLNSGIEIDRQKTVLYDATNTAEAMLQQYKELFILAASYRFTYNGPDDILNAGFVHLRYRHNYKNKIQPEPFKFKEFQKTPLLKSDLGVFNVKIDSIPSMQGFA